MTSRIAKQKLRMNYEKIDIKTGEVHIRLININMVGTFNILFGYTNYMAKKALTSEKLAALYGQFQN